MQSLRPLFLTAALAGVLSPTATGQENTPPELRLSSLLRTMEAMEQLNIPRLPEEVIADRSDSLPDLTAIPTLDLKVPLRGSAAVAWQKQQQVIEDGSARRELLMWRIWRRLLYIPLDKAQLPNLLKPWLELRDLLRDPFLVLAGRSESLQQWPQRYPGHLTAHLAGHLQSLLQRDNREVRAKRIAVVLPLSGALQQAGWLVSTGIRTSWFRLRQQGLKLPELLFFDSNQQTRTLTNQIMSSEVQLVIGPLQKDRVDEFAATLAEHPLHPPTLLLNETEAKLPDDNFWQFGLPVEREIQALVLFARSRGLQRAGALMMASRAGLRAGDALEAAWLELGGEWIGTEVLTGQGEITDAGRDLLLLAASSRRNATLQRIISTKVQHIPRQRSDLDVLFIAAPGSRGHRITAILAYNYLKDIPIYALSSIYRPEESGNEFDLEDVTFMDMPWITFGPQALGYDQSMEAPEYRKRLIAFGIDALLVALRLDRAPPDERLPHWGVTGVLAREDHRISWTPGPATVTQGIARPVQP